MTARQLPELRALIGKQMDRVEQWHERHQIPDHEADRTRPTLEQRDRLLGRLSSLIREWEAACVRTAVPHDR